jgi:hypothetical protein
VIDSAGGIETILGDCVVAVTGLRVVLQIVGRAKAVLAKANASLDMRFSVLFLSPGKTVVFRLSAVGQRGGWFWISAVK